MMCGNYKVALKFSEEIQQKLTLDFLTKNEGWVYPAPDWFEHFVPIILHVYIRFGKWN